ncbi:MULTISPECIES: SDR family NAD(P)-dependent oxidoreductase [Kordiimonas]|jgi:NAD(P)-dependent dehydrogenase (short-subunit alcohol dehydrogenase family)|uniref:SDR family NAD(P)-dependent oxidoreductase n=1 Tax=Kordiimonas TaxID=288021 RepID=UPI00257BDF55|nr:SDR family NAD(P)-dependent oxidoreductase [Kordiimonas sp. UBA4487]
MTIGLDGRVAIITGAGNGLGRSHALGLAERGVKLIVNDLGGTLDGGGASASAAENVAAEIRSRGGEALASGANVSRLDEVEAMVGEALSTFGRVDILVNNAGILRDKTFAKMSMEDFRAVVDVHLMGSANCAKAVWDIMRDQRYGRIVMTSSSSGIYGNFGQSNYGAAKMGCVGLMNVLHLEGRKYNIRVNTLSPTAATRMTEGLIPRRVLDLMTVESVTAGMLALVAEEAPSRLILCAGAGGYAATRIHETEGIYLDPGQQRPEAILSQLRDIVDPSGQRILTEAFEQTDKFVAKAAQAAGIDLEKAEEPEHA